MTKDEFQQRYHDYGEPDMMRAAIEAMKVNAEADGFRVCAVHFQEQGVFALMLDTAVKCVVEIGVVQREDVIKPGDPQR